MTNKILDQLKTVVLPIEVPKEEYNKVINYLNTIGVFKDLEEETKNAEKMVQLAYKVIYILGGNMDILSVFGSFRDTQSDEDCIDFTEQWIEKQKSLLIK